MSVLNTFSLGYGILLGADKDPPPNAYDRAQSMNYGLQHSPSFSIQLKREGRYGGKTEGEVEGRVVGVRGGGLLR